MSKGSGRRPAAVSEAEIAARWAQTFNYNDGKILTEKMMREGNAWASLRALHEWIGPEPVCDLCGKFKPNDLWRGFIDDAELVWVCTPCKESWPGAAKLGMTFDKNKSAAGGE